MKLIYGDFETYYDRKTLTIKKITPPEYICDPRFAVNICCILEGNLTQETFTFENDDVADYLRSLPRPWAFVSYNALFDACILSYRYRIFPDVLIDGLGIVRATILHRVPTGRADLGTISEFMGLDAKGDVIKYVSGMYLDSIKRAGYFDKYVQYCKRDVGNLRLITQRLAPKFPRSEVKIMDMILKMATMPQFWGSTERLASHLVAVIQEKEQLLARVGLDKGQLLSNDRFIAVLQSYGINPPTKISPTTGELTWATAKTDPQMQELAEHPNPDIQALVAARVGVKSTLEETRTQRFISITQAFQTTHNAPILPVALRYAGAHTHRFSGEWKINMQNLPGRKSKKLREALIAPPGHIVLAVDASQIEARLTAWLAGEEKLLTQFRNKEDVYSNFSTIIYHKIITRDDEIERFTGKTCILGLGFQMGSKKLLKTITQQAKDNGYSIEYELNDCEIWVFTFRNEFRQIKALWYRCGDIIRDMCNNTLYEGTMIGPCKVRNDSIILPSGLKLFYYDLKKSGTEYTFRYGRMRKKIYGGKMVENVVQALDRQHVMEAAVRIEERTGLLPAHQVHDELIYVIPERELDTLRVIALEEMRRPAAWGEGLPLDAEVKVGPSYGELKKC